MEIKISFKKDEVKEVLKAHVLKELPTDLTGRSVEVDESYGEFIVKIFDTLPEKEVE